MRLFFRFPYLVFCRFRAGFPRFARFALGLLAASPALSAADATTAKLPAPRTAEIGVSILDISEIDEPSGTFTAHLLLSTAWQDPAQVHDGKPFKLLRDDAATELVNSMWRPMAHFNRATSPVELHHSLLRIYPDGRVEYERQLTVRLATDLDLRKLPFDTQRLKIELESFQHLAHELEFILPPEKLRIASRISLPQWQPRKLYGEVQPIYRQVFDETYSRATVTLEVKRYTQFYIWQMMVPLGIVLGMAFAVFFLPPKDLSDRMSVIIASLLTVVALSYSLHSGLPKISYLTTIDWFFVLAYVFLGLAMAGMVWISNLADRDEARAIRFDNWLRWLYPGAYLLAAAIVVLFSLN